jgi:hypothetical protein
MGFKDMIGRGGNEEYKALLENLKPFKDKKEISFAIGNISINELDNIALFKTLGGILQDKYDYLGLRKTNCILRYIGDWVGCTRSLDNPRGSNQIVELMKPIINKSNETTLQLNNSVVGPPRQ